MKRENIRIEYVRLSELKRQKRNPKAHALPEIMASMKRFGFVSPVVIDEKTGKIVAGHGRLDTLLSMKEKGESPPHRIEVKEGEWMVPVVFGLAFENEKEAEAYVVADNKLTEAGGWIDKMLMDIVKDHKKNLAGFGFNPREIDAFLREMENENTPEDPGPQLSKADQLQRKYNVEVGQIFQMGRHRLMCGDSRDVLATRKLMAGQHAVLFATDPPYGIDYVKTKSGIPVTGYATLGDDYTDIQFDDLRDGKLQDFLESVFKVWAIFLDNAAWYLWHAHLMQGFVAAAAAAAADVLLHTQIIWVKPGFNLTRSGMYHWSHEPCFFGWVRGRPPEWYGPKNQKTVWEIERHLGKGLHPTEKPPELWRMPILNHVKRDEICAEPFAGSGPQFVAAEQLGRICYGMEIDPKYCAVILERMSNMGLTVKLVE